MLTTLKAVLAHYPLSGEITSYRQIPTGHINQTFFVELTHNKQTHAYIVQKINSYVFGDPQKVMENIKNVTDYLRENNIREECGILSYYNTKANTAYLPLDQAYWRVCDFIPNSVSFDTADNLQVLENAGFAFGRFQAMLRDFPTKRLWETIPDFHNTPARLRRLFDCYREDPVGRGHEVTEEMAFFVTNRQLLSRLETLREEGKLPVRVTHNDTKYNNILMEKTTGKPLCVIDLDTIMPGLTMYDFGDAVRFAASTAAEDETDLDKVALDMDRFAAFVRGFVKAMGEAFTQEEWDNLALGAFVITAELAARFLTDYLEGDKYFRIHRPRHNLDRARCQIQLAKDIQKKMDDMNRIVLSLQK